MKNYTEASLNLVSCTFISCSVSRSAES